MKTIKFSATIGVVSGYGGPAILEQAAKISPDAMGIAWQKAAAQVMEQSGVYVSATINSSKALYHTDWGCPEGGEPTYTISGSLNPKFGEPTAWKQAVIDCIKTVKAGFKQLTVTIEFNEVDQVYLDD